MFYIFVIELVVMLGNFFQVGNFKVLVFFYCLYKGVGFNQVVVSVGIQLGKFAFEQFNGQVVCFEVYLVDGGNFQFIMF